MTEKRKPEPERRDEPRPKPALRGPLADVDSLSYLRFPTMERWHPETRKAA